MNECILRTQVIFDLLWPVPKLSSSLPSHCGLPQGWLLGHMLVTGPLHGGEVMGPGRLPRLPGVNWLSGSPGLGSTWGLGRLPKAPEIGVLTRC